MPDTDQEPVLDEYFQLWVLLAQTKDAISRLRERDYAQYGINNERRAILYILHNNGGHAKPVDIARELFRELHSVTEMIKRMEEAGLVTRHKGSGRSKVEVRLTDHGRDSAGEVARQRTRQEGLLDPEEERAGAPGEAALEGQDRGPQGPGHPGMAAQPVAAPGRHDGRHEGLSRVAAAA